MTDDATKIPRFVLGEVGYLQTHTDDPTLRPYPSGERWSWPRSGQDFRVLRGVIQDHRSQLTGKIILAREIPEPMRAEVAELDAEISATRERLIALERERWALLDVAASRGKRVKVGGTK